MIGLHSISADAGRPGKARLLARALVPLWLALVCHGAMAVPTCTVATGATLSFGNVVALASTADQTTNSGTTFWVNCSVDVPAPPSLYSSTTPRALASGGYSIPMALSTVAPGGLELAYVSPGTTLSVPRTGSAQTVVLHARIRSSHFRSLPAGNYGAVLSLTLEY